jgi:long-chain-fatty-acid--CoA ligase ACSBG
MLSYDNLIFNGSSLSADVINKMPADVSIQPEEMRMVSYLPLSHIAGLVFDLINHMLYGCNLYFAKPDALQGTLVETLQWARPTTFLAVPRIWEKFEDRLK